MDQITTLQKLPEILAEMDLTAVYAYVVANNPANQLPYHNLYHTQCMAASCYVGAMYAELSLFERKALVLAGLFHDYDHSGGRTPDSENILRAKEALAHAASVLGLPEALVERSQEFISTTQYPPVTPALDEAERIIRDGDMCQMLYENWFAQVYQGLRTEMAHSRGPLSLAQFCELQRSFFGGIELHSQWGKSVLGKLRSRALRGIELAERAVSLMANSSLSEQEAYILAEAETNGK